MTARFGPFLVHPGSRQLTRDGAPVHLTPKAFDLLLLLIDEAPRVVRKDDLHRRLWPGTFVVDSTLVSVVKELRRALQHDAASPIRTVHRFGYSFAAPLDRSVESETSVSHWIVLGHRNISLGRGEHSIGRDPAAVVRLDAAGVSRHHARIVIDSRQALLEDLGSKNGTVVGGTAVHGAVILKDGDEIRVGPAVMLFRSSPRGASTETMIENGRDP